MLNEYAKSYYETAKSKGFWDKPRNIGEMLMLITSELGEAMEAHRKGNFANKETFEYDIKNGVPLKKAFEKNIKDTFEDELADVLIRLFDMAGGLTIDLDYHVNIKNNYNQYRERLHGKKY